MNIKTIGLSTLPLLLAAALAAAPSSAGAQNADEIMNLARAQWAAENQSQPASQAWGSISDDYTEFNPVVPVLVEGKAMAGRFYEAGLKSGSKGLASEMLNPHVQFHGDAAILTYNYAGMDQDKDGKITPSLAKSTRVYVKEGGKWMLVHANFAPVVAPE